MKAILPVITFAIRHALITPLAIVAGCLLWTVLYFILLLGAVIFGQGLGGPLAYPAGIIAVVVGGLVIGWGIFAPACAVGAMFCGITGLSRFAAIPVVFVSGFLFSYAIFWVFSSESMSPFLKVLVGYAAFLSVPLGAYWWITEGPGAIFQAFRRWRARRIKSMSR